RKLCGQSELGVLRPARVGAAGPSRPTQFQFQILNQPPTNITENEKINDCRLTFLTVIPALIDEDAIGRCAVKDYRSSPMKVLNAPLSASYHTGNGNGSDKRYRLMLGMEGKYQSLAN